MSDEKIAIDFKRKETEAGWINIWDQFGLKSGPVWFDWLQWVLALGAFEFLLKKSHSDMVAVIVGVSYSMLWWYFNGIFYRIEFKGMPLISSAKHQHIFSALVSGMLAFASWRVATSIAHELSILQQTN